MVPVPPGLGASLRHPRRRDRGGSPGDRRLRAARRARGPCGVGRRGRGPRLACRPPPAWLVGRRGAHPRRDGDRTPRRGRVSLPRGGHPRRDDVRSAAPEPGGRLAPCCAAGPRGDGGDRPGPLDQVRPRRRRGTARRLRRHLLGHGSGARRRTGADRSDRAPAGPAGRPAAHRGRAAARFWLDGFRLVRLGGGHGGRTDGRRAPVLDGVPAAGPRHRRGIPVPQPGLPVARGGPRGAGGRGRPCPGPLDPLRLRRPGHPADCVGPRVPGDGRRPRRAAGRPAARRGDPRPRAGPTARERALRDDVWPRPVPTVSECGRCGRVDGIGPVRGGDVPRPHGLGSGHPAVSALQ